MTAYVIAILCLSFVGAVITTIQPDNSGALNFVKFFFLFAVGFTLTIGILFGIILAICMLGKS